MGKNEIKFNKNYHRDIPDGPAYLLTDKDGNIIKREFYVHGTLVV